MEHAQYISPVKRADIYNKGVHCRQLQALEGTNCRDRCKCFIVWLFLFG